MINYELPKEIEIDGKIYPITRGGDYRVVLDIICALKDEELNNNERSYVCLSMFYGEIPENTEEAMNKMLWFIRCGEPEDKKQQDAPPMMDWEQDWNMLVAPINKSLGLEVRAAEYLHWWTFVSGYMEISDKCTFSNVVTIRQKRAKGKKLDKSEQEFFRKNANKIILKSQITAEDRAYLEEVDDDW